MEANNIFNYSLQKNLHELQMCEGLPRSGAGKWGQVATGLGQEHRRSGRQNFGLHLRASRFDIRPTGKFKSHHFRTQIRNQSICPFVRAGRTVLFHTAFTRSSETGIKGRIGPESKISQATAETGSGAVRL